MPPVLMTAPQIADDLTERIRTGEYPPGAQLHYEQLATLYGVKRWTVKRAVALLRARDLAVEVPGRGVYVREDHPS